MKSLERRWCPRCRSTQDMDCLVIGGEQKCICFGCKGELLYAPPKGIEENPKIGKSQPTVITEEKKK